MALILAKLGYEVLVLEKASHPRFTIGESSTPTADLYLARIAQDFGIPELAPLSRYASIKESYPQLDVGPKRGFSYFQHQVDRPFTPGPNHERELVVAASASDALSDSNWHRADIDALVVSLFDKYSVRYLDQCHILDIQPNEKCWQIATHRDGETESHSADYFVDATGKEAIGIRSQGGMSCVDELHTSTCATFAHFEGLIPWSEFFSPSDSQDHPFPCDRAAIHHILDGQWMWQLPFDSGITSCGIVRPFVSNSHSSTSRSPEDKLAKFMATVASYPTMKKQFTDAQAVTPKSGAIETQRIQHYYDRGAGTGWCALPNTVGFVDPLHSKGMAHALSGVYRLGKLFESGSENFSASRNEAVQELGEQFRREILFMDRIISLCYLALSTPDLERFDNFRLATFWYFVAATCFEKQTFETGNLTNAFLFSDNEDFTSHLFQHEAKLWDRAKAGDLYSVKELEELTRHLLDPFDQVRLFRPKIPNMYHRTAAPSKA